MINIDGENYAYDTSIRVQCAHNAVRLFLPKDCDAGGLWRLVKPSDSLSLPLRLAAVPQGSSAEGVNVIVHA